jgi:PHD/YefM family antitoxin component YafN of YafNO toxin-antitoxin module|tara:strand:- start:18456 stop:18653 length:198 start_codon:yes stop_codon:yes gene_type:complete
MIELTVEEFEKDPNNYMDRIEKGEKILIRQPDGRAVVAVPAEELELSDTTGSDAWYDINSHIDAS